MRSSDDKEIPSNGCGGASSECYGVNRTPHHRTALGKPAPSKWDDAQKWLVNLSRVGGGEKTGGGNSKAKPRNSNADDRRLIAPVSKEETYLSCGGGGSCHDYYDDGDLVPAPVPEADTKKVECDDQSIWRINKPSENPTSAVRSICVRDMGTEMTPIASQEPSRTGTPIRATTPAARSPIGSGSSTPVRFQHAARVVENGQEYGARSVTGYGKSDSDQMATRKANLLENKAMAWDEAERAKYMARYKREEVKIQAWENHEKRKAEMEMTKMEVKAERLKSRAQERCTNKLAATRRIAEERRAKAEAKLNEKALRTSERADYIRRTGHLPSSFSLKLPSCCW